MNITRIFFLKTPATADLPRVTKKLISLVPAMEFDGILISSKNKDEGAASMIKSRWTKILDHSAHDSEEDWADKATTAILGYLGNKIIPRPLINLLVIGENPESIAVIFEQYFGNTQPNGGLVEELRKTVISKGDIILLKIETDGQKGSFFHQIIPLGVARPDEVYV